MIYKRFLNVKSIATLFFFIFIIVMPYFRGLFNGNFPLFDLPIYYSFTCASLLMMTIGIYAIKERKYSQIHTSIWVAMAIVLCYYMASFGAASQFTASKSVYIQLVFVTLFIYGTLTTSFQSKINTTLAGLVGSTYLIVLFGLFNWLGVIQYRDAVLHERLGGAFQYANSNGALLSCALIACLLLNLTIQKRPYLIANSLMLVPIFTSLILTYSRGAYLVFGIVWLITLCFLSVKQQVAFIIHSIIAVMASVSIIETLIEIRVSMNDEILISYKGFAFLLIASAIASLLVVGMNYLLERKLLNLSSWSVKSSILPSIMILILSLGAWVSLTLLIEYLPERLQLRLKSTDVFSIFSERGTYYKDAIDIIKHKWLLGSGGGGWAALFETYQSVPYISRQAHSSVLQVASEIGLIGLGLFLFLIIYATISFVKDYKQSDRIGLHRMIFFVFVIALFLHSLIDFDLSYVWIGAVFYLSLGVLFSNSEQRQSRMRSWKLHQLVSKHKAKVYIAALLLLGGVLFIKSLTAIQANNVFEDANKVLNTTRNANDLSRLLNKALSLDSKNTNYGMLNAAVLKSTYEQTQDVKLLSKYEDQINELTKNEPYNRGLIEHQYNLAQMQGYNETVALLSDSIAKHPWDISIYDLMIKLTYGQGLNDRNNGKSNDQNEAWKMAQDVLEKAIAKREYLRSLQAETSGFEPTKDMFYKAGQIYYYTGEYDKASNTFKEILPAEISEEEDKEYVRWYLASIHYTREADTGIGNKLLEQFPAEQQRVDFIINLK
ncbi:O-antigen ligase family protein [Cohnella sp. GCM10027633]|uniref:O-antigen ligase family protein n=1 Tax=unclassified Cohnella TaxID=2636738 RepID=UPI00362C6DCA